jgi:uncharacterized membrane protein
MKIVQKKKLLQQQKKKVKKITKCLLVVTMGNAPYILTQMATTNQLAKAGKMKRQTIIVIITPAKTECWGNLKKACIAHNWAYNTLSKRQLPIEYDGCKIERVPFL